MASKGIPRGKPTSETLCWELAVKIFNTKLTKDPQKIISSSSANTNHLSSSLPNVLKAAEEAKARSEKGRSKFRSNMESVIMTISEYSVAIDVIIQQQPNITAVVWGAVRCLINVALKEVEISTDISNTLATILHDVGRWQNYLLLFPDSARLHSTIAELFAQVLNYLLRASAYYQKPLAMRYVKAGLTPSQSKFQGIFTEITRLSAVLQQEVFLASHQKAEIDQAAHHQHAELNKKEIEAQEAFRAESRIVHSRIDSGVQLQEDLILNTANIMQALDTVIAVDQRGMKGEELEALINRVQAWLRPGVTSVPSFVNWEDGTCEWIFGHTSYQQWKDSSFDKPLWIYGIPGCGKTVMANFLSQKVVANFTLTHFFRSSSDQDSTKASSLLSSVLAQLIRHYTLRSTPRFFATLKAVLPLFDHFASGIDCPFHTLRPLMDDLFGILDDFVLVVDALDECSEINQSTTVTEWLNKVSRRPNARVIILSRYHDSFEDSLCDSFHLRMDSDLVSPDISLFVAAELQRTPKFRGMEKQIMMKIEEARGMFLWAKMMMEYLTKAATSNMVLRRLARFPAGLTAVYEKFLVETAASLEEEDIIRRKEIFMLLAAGVRPLSVEEISVALALKTTGRLHEDGDLLLDPKGEVLRLCWPLAMVVHGEAHLFHMSVKEFLLRSAEPLTKGSVQFSVQQCHTYMARRCLNRLDHTKYAATNRMESLLRHSVSTKKLSRGEISHLPLTLTFYEYACKNWQRHIAAASPSEDLLHQTNQFLHSHAFISWAESLHSISRDDMGPIIEVRAVLRSWQMTIPHVRQSLVNLLDFFTGPYNSAYLSFRDQGDNLLSSVVLERLGIFLNITAEHVPENLFTLYEILKLASEGYERVLGKRHPRTLNATALFCVERLVNKEHSAAETVSAGIASIQREVLGEESPDYFRTRQYQAVALFWQGKHIEAKVCAEESYIGLQRTLGGHQKDTLKSQMYVGWCLEVENELEAAARIYEEVYNAWIPIHGPDNPLSLYSQSCLAISLRKLGDFAAAERHMTQSLAARQRLFGADNLMTIDSAINLAVLYRDMDRPQEALALLEVAVTKGVKTPPIQGFERLCQTEHLRAQIEILAGELDNARRRLEMILLNATAEKLPNNRELFWIRLRLADMLRSEGLDEIAAALFSGIVKQTLDDYSAEIWKDTDPKYQLRIAEVALEFVQKHDTYGAEELLVAHGLNWGHPEDLWVLEGGPGAEI